MKITRTGSIAAVALVGALALAGCSTTSGPSASPTPTETQADYSKLSGTITSGGSSAQANAEAAWTTAFKTLATGVTVNYDKSQGSGGGQTNFLAGAYDFAGSDSPLSAAQTTQAATSPCGATGAVNLPIYLDGVAIIFNVKGVTKLNLSGATIAKIFNLKITDWSDAAITKDNGGTALPAGPITTVARSDGSGTTANFTNYLAGTQKADWPYPADKNWPVAGNVSKQQGGSGVVNAVKAGNGTIGYADHSAIGSLAAASVDGVAFSSDGVAKALTDATTDASNGVAGDLSLKFDYTKVNAKGIYPIPLISYAILCKTFKDATQASLVKGYLGFIASTTGQKVAAANAGSAALPKSILDKVNATLAMVK
ncbi:phosphate ABC transporter substrate-binding protein PstS [Lysinimonas soli]|uniref:Phosphate-binding protein n=1 Tax=Lysinimonas soli TaxID=1074233 RepID=A0ABW0NRF0_9MICO